MEVENHVANEAESTENADNRPKEEEIMCKVCHCACDADSPYLSPCKCKGGMKYIHKECLEEWLSISNKKKCDICGHPFEFQKKFRPDTPKTISLYYFVAYLLFCLKEATINVLCFAQMLAKILFVLYFNTRICHVFVHSVISMHSAVVTGISVSLANLFHSLFIIKAYKVVNSYRTRMQSGAVLQTLVSDAVSASGTTRSNRTQAEESTESNFSDEQIFSSLGQEREINIRDILFRRPTLENLKTDLKAIMMLCITSFCYPPIYYFCTEAGRILLLASNSLGTLDYLYLKHPFAFEFLGAIGLSSSFPKFLGAGVFFSALLIALYQLKISTRSRTIKNIFYITKCYSMMFVTTFSIFVILGVVSHACFSAAFTAGRPVFSFDAPFPSLLIHFTLGGCFVHLSKKLRQKLRKRFRPGLMISPLKNETFTVVVDHCNSITLKQFLTRTLSTFIGLTAFPLILFNLSAVRITLPFQSRSNFQGLLYAKMLFIIFRNSVELIKILVFLIDLTMRLLSTVFGADNYLYNKMIPIADKSCLLWAVNVRYVDEKYQSAVEKVNGLLREFNNSQPTAAREDNATGQEPLTKRNVSVDGISSANDSEILNISFAMNEERKITKTKASETLINSINEQARVRIQGKYEINDRRIAKYYGHSHNRRVSLFYKPRYFWLFKIISLLSCIFLISFVLNSVIRSILFIQSFLPFYSKQEMAPIIFTHCLGTAIQILSMLVSLSNKPLSIVLRASINKSILLLYTNIIFPVLGALGYVFLFASMNRFFSFTTVFTHLHAFSSVCSSLFEMFFVTAPVASTPVPRFITCLASYLVLKFSIFLCFLAYTKLIAFTSVHIPLFLTFFICAKVFTIGNEILNGSLKERIKEYFFLDSTTVSNYPHTD